MTRFRACPLAVSLGAVATSCGIVALGYWIGTPLNRVRLFAGAVLAFTLAGILARGLFWTMRSSGAFRRRLLVIGAGACAWDLVELLQNEGANPQYEVTFLHSPEFGPLDPRLVDAQGPRIITLANDDILAAARFAQADEVIVAPDERRGYEPGQPAGLQARWLSRGAVSEFRGARNPPHRCAPPGCGLAAVLRRILFRHAG